MGAWIVSLVAFACLAVVGCRADSDDHGAALQKCMKDMEEDGYECIGSVGIETRSVHDLMLDDGELTSCEAKSAKVSQLFEASGWGRPEDMDSITFLEDGTLCVRRKGAAAAQDSDAMTNQEGQKASTSGVGGRRLSRHSVALPESRADSNAHTTSLRGLRQRSSSFDAELTIPFFQDQVRVGASVSTELPFSRIGQVGLGCSGALVGPCHYLTAGHCVFDPESFQVRNQLEFSPGRNGRESLFPLGRYQALRINPSDRWIRGGDPRYDAAIVQVSGRPGDEIGVLPMGAEGLPANVDLNIAGYPGDKDLGQMWYDFCPNVNLPFNAARRTMVFHSCQTTPGSSGSAMWTYSPEDGSRRIVAVHTSQIIRSNPFSPFPSFDFQPAGVFMEGDLLREMQAAIADMRCDA